jgi:hypothetical protein
LKPDLTDHGIQPGLGNRSEQWQQSNSPLKKQGRFGPMSLESTGKYKLFSCAAAAILVAGVAQAGTPLTAADLGDVRVYGHIEKVSLHPGSIVVPARLDTGARRSSLNAQEIETFERDGKQWVRFIFDDREGGEHRMELPVIDEIGVRQAAGREDRLVVRLGLCVGRDYAETDFTLTDRGRMTYPVLVGRVFLGDRALVDSERGKTVDPACDAEAIKAANAEG